MFGFQFTLFVLSTLVLLAQARQIGNRFRRDDNNQKLDDNKTDTEAQAEQGPGNDEFWLRNLVVGPPVGAPHITLNVNSKLDDEFTDAIIAGIRDEISNKNDKVENNSNVANKLKQEKNEEQNKKDDNAKADEKLKETPKEKPSEKPKDKSNENSSDSSSGQNSNESDANQNNNGNNVNNANDGQSNDDDGDANNENYGNRNNQLEPNQSAGNSQGKIAAPETKNTDNSPRNQQTNKNNKKDTKNKTNISAGVDGKAKDASIGPNGYGYSFR